MKALLGAAALVVGLGAAAAVAGSRLPEGTAVVSVMTAPIPASRYVLGYKDPVGRHPQAAMVYDGQRYVYDYLNAPSPQAIVVLLHGSNRSGAAMVDMWRETAARNRLAVVAPTSPEGEWRPERHTPAFFQAVIDAARAELNIPQGPVFLFGHSNGARRAATLASEAPTLFDAVAVHGGYGVPSFISLGQRLLGAPPPSPTLLILGDQDHIFPESGARSVAAALAQMGGTAQLIMLRGHNHWYYTVGPWVNDRAWDFFAQYLGGSSAAPGA